MTPSRDAGRHDRDHRATAKAAIPPSAHHELCRGLIGCRAASDLALAETVPDDLEPVADGIGSDPASWAARRPHPIDGRHRLKPELDLDVRMNDMTRALDLQHILPEHDEALARLVTFLWPRSVGAPPPAPLLPDPR